MFFWRAPLAFLLVLFVVIVRAAKDVVLDPSSSMINYTPGPEVGWINRTLAGCEAQGWYMCSYTDNSEFTVTFRGIGFSLTFMRFANGARALIEVDGVQQATVDTFSTSQQCAVEIFRMANLTDSQHTVRIADATHSIGSRGLVFKSMTYTENVPDGTTTPSSTGPGSVTYTVTRTPTSTIEHSDDDDESKPQIGLIAGAAAGGVVALLLVGGIVWFVMRRRRPQPRTSIASAPDVRQSASEALIAPWVPDRTVTHPAYSHQRMLSQSTNRTDSSTGYQETNSPQIRPASFNPYASPSIQPSYTNTQPHQNAAPTGVTLQSNSSMTSLPSNSRFGDHSTTIAPSPPPKEPDQTKDDPHASPPPYMP